jgi:hypothetical protein
MSSTPIVFQQLLWQLPHLLVYLAGLILAIVFHQRAPRAAMLTMVGTGVMLILAIGVPFLQMTLINQRTAGNAGNISTMMSVVSFTSGLIRAIALGLIIAGVFVGRKADLQVGFPVAQAIPPTPPLPR